MKLKTPLERAIEALEARVQGMNPGHRREGVEYALALCRSFEDYDPDHDFALYSQGFADARRIYSTVKNVTTYENQIEYRRDENREGMALQGEEGNLP